MTPALAAYPTASEDEFIARFCFLPNSRHTLNCVQRLPRDHFWRTLISDQDIWEKSYPASVDSERCIFQSWIVKLWQDMDVVERLKSSQNVRIDELEDCKRILRQNFLSYLILSGEIRFPHSNLPDLDDEASLGYSTICRYILDRIPSSLETDQSPSVQKHMAEYRCSMPAVASAMQYRELFTTSDDCIGKGPQSVRKGDQVWIISGTRVPYVLRPLGKVFLIRILATHTLIALVGT